MSETHAAGIVEAAGRLDLALVAVGLSPSRAKAREAIEAGLVRVDGQAATRPAQVVPLGARLEAELPYPWVSRGGVKLAAALDRFRIDPVGCPCVDIGASTGGFTDVLLARGASHVHAVDVGHDQLHPRLRADARVSDLSGTDARGLGPGNLDPTPQLAVCDASFISLGLLLPGITAVVTPVAWLVVLVKPQFEVGPGRTVKGIVRDPALWDKACRQAETAVRVLGWDVIGLMPSPIVGGTGNHEFLLGARRG